MKVNWILYILFLTVLLIPFPASADRIDKYQDLKLYYPMNKGSLWIYNLGGLSDGMIYSVTDCVKDTDGIEICTVSQTSPIGRNFFGYSYLGDAVFERLRKLAGHEWELSRKLVLKSPLKVGGPIWEDISFDNEKSQYRVVKILPTMEVKAGKFNNVIVVEKTNFIKDKKNKWKIFWVDGKKFIEFSYYAPNVGLIGAGLQGMLTLELVEYRPGDPEKSRNQ